MADVAISARVPKEIYDDLELFVKTEQTDKSTATRKLLERGLSDWKREKALALLAEGKVTVWKAASIAGVSVWEMVDLIKERRVTLPIRAEDILSDLKAAIEEKR